MYLFSRIANNMLSLSKLLPLQKKKKNFFISWLNIQYFTFIAICGNSNNNKNVIFTRRIM